MSDNPSPTMSAPDASTTDDLGVLVGFDGSDHALAALDWARACAERRGSALTIAAAYRTPVMIYPNLASLPHEPGDESHRRAAEANLEMAHQLLGDHPGRVRYLAAQGDSVGALVDLSSKAELAVVGARGRGGFVGRILGSVASALPAHAHCPTVVLIGSGSAEKDAGASDDGAAEEGSTGGGASTSAAPVVVGLDGSDHARTAILHAAQMATEAGVPLHLLLVLPPLNDPLVWYPELVVDVTDLTAKRRSELDEALRTEIGWVESHFPSLPVSGSVRVGDPVEELAKDSAQASLTVVGCRGRGAIRSTLLGSTSRALLHKANGPVMVVPWTEDERVATHPDRRS